MRPSLAANRSTSPSWRLLSSTDRYGMEMDSLHLAQAWGWRWSGSEPTAPSMPTAAPA